MLDSTILLVSTDIHLAEITSHTCIKSSKAQTPNFRRKQFFVFTCFNMNLVLFFFCFNIICLSFHLMTDNPKQYIKFTNFSVYKVRSTHSSPQIKIYVIESLVLFRPKFKVYSSYIGMTRSLRFSHNNFNPD